MPEWRNGRRGGLKNRCRKTCEFDSRLGHHSKPAAPHHAGPFSFLQPLPLATVSQCAHLRFFISSDTKRGHDVLIRPSSASSPIEREPRRARRNPARQSATKPANFRRKQTRRTACAIHREPFPCRYSCHSRSAPPTSTRRTVVPRPSSLSTSKRVPGPK